MNPNLTSQFDQIWGTKTPSPGTPTQSRADEIRALGKSVPPPPSLEDNKSEPNVFQKTAGLFLNPIMESGARFGQAIGATGLKAADLVTGGAVGRMTPEGNLDDALNRALNTPQKLPLTGGELKPFSQETPESTLGRGVSTVALGTGSVPVAGALMGAGSAMEENKGAGEVAITSLVYMLLAKIMEVGFQAASPYITKALAKYGTPLVEKLQAAMPDYAKPMLDNIVKTGQKTTQAIAEKDASKQSQQSMEEALGFVKKQNPTKGEMEQAFTEGRAKTNVKGQQELITTPQQQRQASALQPLIESGELKPSTNGLPTPEQREVIIQKVEQLNQGLKQMVSNPKYNQPFNADQLSKALQGAKKDTEIVFASDPTIERVYDALISEAQKSVKTNDVSGLLEARQNFDKIPAVKKVLDSLGSGTSGENLKREAVLAIRGTMNNFAADLLSKEGVGGEPAGKAFIATLRNESDLLGAVNSMAENYPTTFAESNKTFFEKHPQFTNLLKGAIGGSTLLELGKKAFTGSF